MVLKKRSDQLESTKTGPAKPAGDVVHPKLGESWAAVLHHISFYNFPIL